MDDDSIISHLETLKTEAGEIARKVEETDIVMAEVENTSRQYIPLAAACSSIYFTLESINQVSNARFFELCHVRGLKSLNFDVLILNS